MKIKEWKYDDMMKKISNYGTLWERIDVERDADHFNMPKVDEDGYITITCRTEIAKESEKAVQVKFDGDAWTEWLPKSCIKM